MRKLNLVAFLAVLLGALIAVGCTTPTSSTPTAVTGNAIVKSLTMKNVTPANTTPVTASRSLDRSLNSPVGDTSSSTVENALAAAFSSDQNVPQLVVTLMQNYVGNQTLAIGVANSFNASASTVLTGLSAPAPTGIAIGASQIKIVDTGSSTTIYWKTEFLSVDFGFGGGATDYSLQIKLVLNNYSTAGDATTYQLATIWINQLDGTGATPVNKIKAINNLNTGDYVKYSPITGTTDATAKGSGEIFASGNIPGGGVYQYTVLKRGTDGTPTVIAAYGNGTSAVMATNKGGTGGTLGSAGPNATFGADATFYGTGTAYTFPSSVALILTTAAGSSFFNTYAATVAGWNSVYGVGGSFASDLNDFPF